MRPFIAFLGGIQIILNFSIQLIVLASLGAGIQTDAYIAAQTVPTVISSIMITVLTNFWFTYFTKNHYYKQKLKVIIGSAQVNLAVISIGVSFIYYFINSLIIGLIFTSFSAETIHFTSELSFVFMLSNLISCHSSVYISALRVQNKHFQSELIQASTFLALTISIYLLLPIYGLFIVAKLMLLRSITLYVLLHHFTEYPSFTLKKLINDRSSIRKTFWLIFTSSVTKTSPIVDRYWTSQSTAGGMTIYNLSQSAIAAIISIIDKSLCIPANAAIGKEIASKNLLVAKKQYYKAIREITLIAIIFEGFLILCSQILSTKMLSPFEFEILPKFSTQLINLSILSIGYLHSSATASIVNNIYFAFDNVKTPMIIGLIGFAISLLTKSIAFIYFGLPGMAIANSVYYLSNYVVSALLMERFFNISLGNQ